MTHRTAGLGWVAMLMVLGCGGEAALGETCGDSGADGECEDDGVCGKRNDGTETLYCLRVCTSDAVCSSGEQCNGVSGTSIKGCRLKENK